MLSNPLNPNPNIVTNVNHIDGIYRGVVEDNDDPLNLCRLRVRVPYLNGMPDSPDGIPTEGLPWAAACVTYGGPSYGQVLIPEVGSTVWVMFENQAKDRPVWIGCSYGAQSLTGTRALRTPGMDTFTASRGEWVYADNREDTPYTFKEHRKNSKVVIHTPKGFEISIDEADEHERLEIIDRTGQIIRMHCPVTKEGNRNNNAMRVSGSVAENDTNEGILEYALDLEDDTNQNYILIESQSNSNNVNPSYVKLSKNRVRVTCGESMIEQSGKTMTFDNGLVRSIYDGDTNTYVITNQPNSVFQMDTDSNAIARGGSEVVVRDDVVEVDNGKVGIRLTDAIELHGPVRWGNGSYGGYWDDDWMRLYYPHIKLATGQSSIILDGENVTVSGRTRVASGRSSVTVDDDIKLSGDTDLTNENATVSLRDDRFKVSADETEVTSGKSSIRVTDADKLGRVDEDDGDILISGDVKIATGHSSVIVHDEEVDISSPDTKIADGEASLIVARNHVEANGWLYDQYDDEGHLIPDPNRIHDTTMGDVEREDVRKELEPMDDVGKGDVSIDDYSYEGWFHGQHIPMLPVQ